MKAQTGLGTSMELWGTMQVGEDGHLRIGGCDTAELATAYGTPLFVYDEAWIRDRIQEFRQALSATGFEFEIAYASKAFCTVAMCQLIQSEGLALDVVSGGELYTALEAGVNPQRIHMHGNNKSAEELAFGVSAGIGVFVVDNFLELSSLQEIAAAEDTTVDVLLRIAPGVEAHTHDYISTGQQDSKFGFDLESGQAEAAIRAVSDCANLRCIGLHCHIGSQIFRGEGFVTAASRMAELYINAVVAGLPMRVLNLGGGFGIRYTNEDTPDDLGSYILTMADAVRHAFAGLSLPLPELWIEPGRSLVGPAGTTLYSVGSQKEIPGVRRYLAVDGGMTDNPRLALYGAKYEAALANRMTETHETTWTIAGKCCESGDIVVWDAPLPTPRDGDVLAVFSTGAYNYSMASHYNRLPQPAVVFVRDGKAAVVVERETWQDVIRNDRPLHYE